jgi:hypothetical protein
MTENRCIIGMDAGTSVIKAVAFDQGAMNFVSTTRRYHCIVLTLHGWSRTWTNSGKLGRTASARRMASRNSPSSGVKLPAMQPGAVHSPETDKWHYPKHFYTNSRLEQIGRSVGGPRGAENSATCILPALLTPRNINSSSSLAQAGIIAFPPMRQRASTFPISGSTNARTLRFF